MPPIIVPYLIPGSCSWISIVYLKSHCPVPEIIFRETKSHGDLFSNAPHRGGPIPARRLGLLPPHNINSRLRRKDDRQVRQTGTKDTVCRTDVTLYGCCHEVIAPWCPSTISWQMLFVGPAKKMAGRKRNPHALISFR